MTPGLFILFFKSGVYRRLSIFHNVVLFKKEKKRETRQNWFSNTCISEYVKLSEVTNTLYNLMNKKTTFKGI